MSSKLSKAINRIAPDAQFVIRGENIEWHSENYPTQEEINLSLLAIDAELYKEQRAMAYKPLAEQLDMQYWDSVNGTDTWKQHIDAVKTAHPKPLENA